MLNLDYPDPQIPGPALPKMVRREASGVRGNQVYRAYVWLLDPERPWTAVCFLYVALSLCISGALDDWRWFAWGVGLPIIAAGTVFVGVFVAIVAISCALGILRR